MAQLNISLPEGLRQWVETCVSQGRYSSASDYVRDLLRRDQEHAAEVAWLQAEIDKGRQSGVDPREPEQILKDIVAEGRARHG